MDIPVEIIDCVTKSFGDKGKAWLQSFPALLEQCITRFAISLEGVVPNVSFNFVSFARKHDGTEVVLKIGCPHRELFSEMDYLSGINDECVVQLLDCEKDLGAMLLERISPGITLKDMHKSDDTESTLIAASIMRNLLIDEPQYHSFPTVLEWVRAIENGCGGSVPNEAINQALCLAKELDASKKKNMLLHGDLHHENILLDSERGWRAIDPKGVIGDSVFQAARFMRNPTPGLYAMENPAAVAKRRLDYLSGVFACERNRIAGWAFVDCVLGACWSAEGGGEDWKNTMKDAEILSSFL